MKYFILYTVMQFTYNQECKCAKIKYSEHVLSSINDISKIEGKPIKIELKIYE